MIRFELTVIDADSLKPQSMSFNVINYQKRKKSLTEGLAKKQQKNLTSDKIKKGNFLVHSSINPLARLFIHPSTNIHSLQRL